MAQQRRRRLSSSRGVRSLPFEPINYLLLLIGVGLIGVGFVAMRLENAVDGWISLYLSPLLILGGFGQVVVAILYRPDSNTPA